MVQTNKRPVGRFAPTPSGRLHLGNLACALVAYLSVAARGGALRLRIEDLDAARCAAMEENTRWLLDDLSYFGIPFEGEVLYQSRRTEIYEQAFNKLKEKGLIYPCYCSRAELHAATAPNRGDAAPVYDRRCLLHPPKVLPARPPAYRVRVPAAGGSALPTACSAHTARNRSATAAISSCAGRMGFLPISWRWWWTTRLRASARWSGGAICSPAHRGKSTCNGSWVCPRRNTATFRS